MVNALPTLRDRETCVVICDLRGCGEPELAQHRALLSASEHARNARLGHELLRERDAHCRGLLRRHLAHFLDTPAESLALDCTDRGKPVLADEAHPLHFNLSHSGHYVALAFHSGAPIGVDLEQIKDRQNAAKLAARFFSTQEAGALRELSYAAQLSQFYRLWTLKEAYIKARGGSIFDGLKAPRFDVEPVPANTCMEIRRDDTPPHELSQFWSWTLASGYQLAAAVIGQAAVPARQTPTVLATPLLTARRP